MKTILQLSMLLFVVTISFGQTPIATYNFDNGSTANANNTNPFSVNSGTSFVPDRNGIANSAFNINMTGSSATILNLPYGAATRSVSLWVKLNTVRGFNFLYNYGQINTGFDGAYLSNNSAAVIYFASSGGNHNLTTSVNNSDWVHYVFTFDGLQSKIYKNGILLGTSSVTRNTINQNNIFRLGLSESGAANNFNGALDELKIYDTVLTQAQITQLYNGTVAVAPVVTNLPNVFTTSTTANISFTVNPGGAEATTEIFYANFDSPYFSSAGPTSSAGTTAQVLTHTFTNLISGFCFYYYIVATNSAGTSIQTPTAIFCTDDANNQKTPIYHFEFNGNTQDKNDPSVAFTNDNSGFVNNNTAISLLAQPQTLNLPFLPVGGASRTVSIKFMFANNVLNENPVRMFDYGSTSETSVVQNYDFIQFDDDNGGHIDQDFTNTVRAGIYYNMVFVYDGLDYKIYNNGNQITNGSSSLNTVGTLFRLVPFIKGTSHFGGQIDDLRIYNSALTANQITALNNNLSNESFNGEMVVGLYPNPAADVLNIAIEKELKSVEIYSVLGQKVLSATSNKVNVSGLNKGMYMVRVQDIFNGVSIQKLIIK